MQELIEEAKKKMLNSYDIFLNGIKGIRTGRAHPSLLDGMVVSVDGSKFKLNQISSVNAINAKTLSITIWDSSNVSYVRNAIMSSGLNLNPIVEGSSIRLIMPDLSEESRRSYVKNVKKQAEEAKIVSRNIVRDFVSKFKDMEKAKEISEDESKKNVEEVRRLTVKQEKEIDVATKAKEDEIMST